MQRALGDAVRSRHVANVPEGPDAERVVRELARQGEQLIFTTSFGYMESVLRVARDYPGTRFEQCSGYKLAANVGAYNGRFYQGRYLAGMVAGHMSLQGRPKGEFPPGGTARSAQGVESVLQGRPKGEFPPGGTARSAQGVESSRRGVAGMVASFPIPEVIQGINAFTLGMRAVNPEARMKVVWANTWYDPGREADAARALIAQGAEVLTHHTNSPAAVQVAQEEGRWAVGYCSDEAQFGPRAQLTAVTLHWGDFYVGTVREALAGRWKPDNVWGGMGQGFVRLAPFLPAVPEAVRRQVLARQRDIAQGRFQPFSGRILDNRGGVMLDGGAMSDAQIQAMNRYVMGVDGELPRA
ncbi:Purine-binding protein BAB2_0673 [Thiomonas sp. X19]|uniref:BMP family ABC transporter substrate-binding protein n=1 Tax=Thiomonas sp. X19 TaxID=1050370 RepID=UPI000B67CC76|nr:BMP family ABC transporter substrate-binding protein [Thiomonas sp. X19]SCC92325.1 Purine-binding protein BAB2_0673 [Thiomonas sp. X19]